MFRGTLNSLNLFEADLSFALPALLVGILVVVAVAATVVPARRASGGALVS
jgi:ABC-type lipoprotein release transport system permease subunit